MRLMGLLSLKQVVTDRNFYRKLTVITTIWNLLVAFYEKEVEDLSNS